MRERGFTLIETLLVVGIIVIISASGWGFAWNNRAFALKSATTIFDAELADARAVAASNEGAATLVFAPAASGVQLHVEPEAAVAPQTLPADVSEAVLGSPPFSITVDAWGHATGLQPCPSGGAFVLTFAAGGSQDSRLLPCPAVAAGPPQPAGTMPP